MSRDLSDDSYYISNAKKIPIKWTAPEVSSGWDRGRQGSKMVGTLPGVGHGLQDCDPAFSYDSTSE